MIPTYTEAIRQVIDEDAFQKLVELAKSHPAALRNIEVAVNGGNCVRVLLAHAAQLCGSTFRPSGWM